MAQVTISLDEKVKCTVEAQDVVTLTELLQLIHQAVQGVGYVPKGELIYWYDEEE